MNKILPRRLKAFLLFGALTGAVVAQVGWQQIESSSTGILPAPIADVEPTASMTIDVDHDGDADLVVGGRNSGPALTLWRHDAGHWTREIIEPDDVHIEAGGATHDIDGDGDLDLVFGGDYRGHEIWWWENPSQANTRWVRRVVKRDEFKSHHDQIFGDFDGDGEVELISWNQSARRLLRLQIPADPKSAGLWPVDTIFSWPNGGPSHEGLAKADIDGDGIEDIIGGGYWFKHTGGGMFTAEAVDLSMTFTRAGVGQFIKGGRPEILFVPGDADGPLNLYQWKDGHWAPHTLIDHVIHGHNLQIGDIDGDGNSDILVAEMGQWTNQLNNPNARVLVLYGDGQGGFSQQIVSNNQGVHETRLADLNGDGRLDIFAKPFRHNAPRLVVWLNKGTHSSPLPLDQWQRHLVDDSLPDDTKRIFVEAIDLDGDGLRDLVSGPYWHKNPGRLDGEWERHAIGEGFGNLATGFDVDRDGDIDLIGTNAKFMGNQFVLAINDGQGNFRIRTDLPAGSGDFLQGVAASRLESNATWIALSWHENPNGLEALVFAHNGATDKWELKPLFSFSRNEQLTLGDIDRDHRTDLLLGDYWLRNLDYGWSLHRIGNVQELNPKAETDRSRLADIDGDGCLDSVVALENATHLVWFKQPSHALATWERHVIAEVPGQGFSMDVADFDDDGDMDVVVGEHRNPDKQNRVLLFENVDTHGGKWEQHVIDTGPANVIDHHDGTLPVDLDGDGDIDIVSIGYYNSKLWILENKAINHR